MGDEERCEFCDLIKQKKHLLFENDNIYVMHDPSPAALGHLLVLPKKHFQIIEQIPDYLVGELFTAANKASTTIFEALKAQGTNIMLQNGVAAGQKNSHLIIHVIPRRQEDGLNLMWQPKQFNEEEMSTVELQIKEQAKNIGGFEKEEKKKPVEIKDDLEQISEEDEKENYMIKQLRRIP